MERKSRLVVARGRGWHGECMQIGTRNSREGDENVLKLYCGDGKLLETIK